MRGFLTIFLAVTLITLIEACAMGGKSIKPRKMQDKMWHLCQDSEMQYHNNLDPVGKVCNQTCLKRKKGKCNEWQRNIKDLNKKEDFLFFRNGAFVLIDEDQLK